MSYIYSEYYKTMRNLHHFAEAQHKKENRDHKIWLHKDSLHLCLFKIHHTQNKLAH